MSENVKIERETLFATPLALARKVDRVEVQRIDLSPGQTVGLHLHPCPVVGYVSAGSINFQIEGQPAKLLETGKAFYEPADARVSHFDNASPSAGASFIAFYLLADGQQELIEMIEPTSGAAE